MPRPMWNGSISFGLVNVPVKLFRAQAPKDVRFHQLHATDNSRIQQKRWCPVEDREIPYEEIVKGYEIASDQYVIIEPDELSTLDPVSTQTIDIDAFVDLDQIDPIYFDKAYYVAPAARAEKPYALLVKAMAETNKVAIAKFVMRTKEYLCAIRAVDETLVLETMFFSDEIIATSEIDLRNDELDEPKPKELKMATQLVESLSAEFTPSDYVDEYREKVLALIEAKAEGQAVVRNDTEQPAPIVDLMEALEASLARAGQTGEKKRVNG